jgi:glyoxylase-like metal-dependent hydrolase (beta-lactamase superfamily II)
VFIGDTLFRPDYGTARTDFPGGNAGELYASIQQLLALPDDTMLYLCHDYPSHLQSAPQASCSVREARDNVQLQAGDMNGFVRFREHRDAELDTPKLLYPAIQINLAAGRLPEPELEQQRFLKLPIFVDP